MAMKMHRMPIVVQLPPPQDGSTYEEVAAVAGDSLEQAGMSHVVPMLKVGVSLTSVLAPLFGAALSEDVVVTITGSVKRGKLVFTDAEVHEAGW